MAKELVRQRVAVLVASGGTAVARTAKEATRTIPIVFAIADDPVANGLVDSVCATVAPHTDFGIIFKHNVERHAGRGEARNA
jgi:hypothetical protein